MTTLLEKINIKYKKLLENHIELLIGDILATAFGYNVYSHMQNKYMEEAKEFLEQPILQDEIMLYITNKELINGVNVTEETLKEYTDEILEKLNKPFIHSETLGYIDILLLSIVIRNNRFKRIIYMIPQLPNIYHPRRPKLEYSDSDSDCD
jgi:hypothetical protein